MTTKVRAAVLILPPVILSVVAAALQTAGGRSFFRDSEALGAIPIAASVAILKYRLYEIDVIINRALVYGTLTAILAATYLGIVVVLQRLVDPFTADSDMAIAGSTLAVAALFGPLRTRVQSFIDRRFYRRKYDADRTLSGFSARLRDQIDLDSLAEELVKTVGETVQPAHASLWFKRTEAAG